MVTNIDTGSDHRSGFDPLMAFMLVMVLIAVAGVGVFMWNSYQSGGVPKAPTTISMTVKR